MIHEISPIGIVAIWRLSHLFDMNMFAPGVIWLSLTHEVSCDFNCQVAFPDIIRSMIKCVPILAIPSHIILRCQCKCVMDLSAPNIR